MTIKELYENAVKDGVEEYEIRLQYQDDGGTYVGSAYYSGMDYDQMKKEVILW